MAADPVTSTGSFPRILWTLLLLAASLNAHNQKWDNPVCTEPLEVSAPRGSRVLMACNISNTFRDVTIKLTADGKTTTIFDQKPPGSYCKDSSWHLHIQGGHAQLVITNARDIHAGEYLWSLHGLQRKDEILTLNVTDLDTTDQEPESLQVNAEPPPSGSDKAIVVAIIIIIIVSLIIGVSVCVCRKRSRSSKYYRYEGPEPGLSHGFPGGSHGPHRTLPKVFHVLQQKVLKGPY